MEITKEQLDKMLSDHKEWLESEGKSGKRFEFKGDLSGADFSGADLRRADLGEAILDIGALSKAKTDKYTIF